MSCTQQYIRDRVIIDPITQCWNWQRSTVKGYGQFREAGKLFLAHRASYEAFVGPIPEGLTLDHLCRNEPCCNPAHLEPVTHQVNCQRGNQGAWQKAKTHCPKGHEYTAANTRRHAHTGARVCRECGRLYAERRNAKIRAKKAVLNSD